MHGSQLNTHMHKHTTSNLNNIGQIKLDTGLCVMAVYITSVISYFTNMDQILAETKTFLLFVFIYWLYTN